MSGSRVVGRDKKMEEGVRRRSRSSLGVKGYAWNAFPSSHTSSGNMRRSGKI